MTNLPFKNIRFKFPVQSFTTIHLNVSPDQISNTISKTPRKMGRHLVNRSCQTSFIIWTAQFEISDDATIDGSTKSDWEWPSIISVAPKVEETAWGLRSTGGRMRYIAEIVACIAWQIFLEGRSDSFPSYCDFLSILLCEKGKAKFRKFC